MEGVDVMCGCDVCVMCECGDVWMWSVGMCDVCVEMCGCEGVN